MSDIKWGTVSSLSGGSAYVKLEASAEPLPKSMRYPKGANISVGDNVAVIMISGTYVIIGVY